MIHTFEVEPDSSKIRADKWISQQIPELSRSLIQKAFDEDLVSVNGSTASKSTKLLPGDLVEFQPPEVVLLDLTPRNIPLTILFEDEHLLALDKPAGMVVHPGAGTDNSTLVHALLYHCKGRLSGIGGVERPGIVHRLDRETSGVMVVAKTDAAHKKLSEDFAKRNLTKQYLAIVAGVPDRLSGSIKKPIGRHSTHRHKMTVRDDGKPAHTDWEFLGKAAGPISLLRCQIHSGRTHQIRVHLSDMKFPILGDDIYGYRANSVKLATHPERTMLHAYGLKLVHPITAEKLNLFAQPPADFQELFPDWSQFANAAGVR